MRLAEISNWFKANKLSVNASKTNYVILGLGTSHITNKYIDVSEHCHDDDEYNTTNIACLFKEQISKQKINVILGDVPLERLQSS